MHKEGGEDEMTYVALMITLERLMLVATSQTRCTLSTAYIQFRITDVLYR